MSTKQCLRILLIIIVIIDLAKNHRTNGLTDEHRLFIIDHLLKNVNKNLNFNLFLTKNYF